MSKTMNQTPLQNRNTLETVLSEAGLMHMECILYSAWDNLDDCLMTSQLMKLLDAYVKTVPCDKEGRLKVSNMIQDVSSMIQHFQQLAIVVETENPGNWFGAFNGFHHKINN